MGRPCLFYPLTVKAIFIYGLWRPIYGASYYKEGRTALPSQGVRWLGGCSGLCGIVGWGFESPGSHLFCDNIAIIHARSKVFCTCAGCNVLCVGWVRPTRQSYVWARLLFTSICSIFRRRRCAKFQWHSGSKRWTRILCWPCSLTWFGPHPMILNSTA
jgi:hypothetical protein